MSVITGALIDRLSLAFSINLLSKIIQTRNLVSQRNPVFPECITVTRMSIIFSYYFNKLDKAHLLK